MSGWDAPTGGWDPRGQTEDSAEPDEQGYQQGQPAGAHRAAAGAEALFRPGRRGLPGYDQAQGNDPAAGYGQDSGYGQDAGTQGTAPSPVGSGRPAFGARGPAGPRRGLDQDETGPIRRAADERQGYGAFQGAPYRSRGYQGQTYPQEQNGYGRPEQARFDQGPQNGYGSQGGYGQDAYPPAAFSHSGYQDEDDGYAGQDFEDPGGGGYDDGDLAPRGPRPPQLTAQQVNRVRTILYLAASVVGVIVIVFLVVHLTKSGSGTPSGSATPGTAASHAPGAPPSYVLTRAPRVGSHPLDTSGTALAAREAGGVTASVRRKMASKGIGTPRSDVVAVYNLGPVTDITSPGFKGIMFVGFNGTFKPADVMRLLRSGLHSSRVVPAGPHGGQMACGYNTSSGSKASECVWVTKTTLGVVEFIVDGNPAKYPNASKLALEVRQAVEVQGK